MGIKRRILHSSKYRHLKAARFPHTVEKPVPLVENSQVKLEPTPETQAPVLVTAPETEEVVLETPTPEPPATKKRKVTKAKTKSATKKKTTAKKTSGKPRATKKVKTA